MKECIVILGMHRSGTSVLTGLLNILGCYAGADMMQPTKDNPKGYFENVKIYNLNEKILKDNDSSWDDELFSIDQITPKQLSEYVQLAKNIIIEELKYVKKLVLKDPRICLLFPIWEQALTALNINIKTIILYRSPMEVALSLLQRDEMPIEQGLLLWSHYFFHSEKFSRRYQRLIIEYNTDFVELDRLLTQLSKFSDLQLSDEHLKHAKEFYTPSLKHQDLSLANTSSELPHYLSSIISLLANRDFDDFQTIDKLSKEYTRHQRFFLHNKKALHKIINEQTNANASIQSAIDKKNDQLHSLQEKVDGLQVKLAEQQQANLKEQHILAEDQQKKVDDMQTIIDAYQQKSLEQDDAIKTHRENMGGLHISMESQQKNITQQVATISLQQVKIGEQQTDLDEQHIQIQAQKSKEDELKDQIKKQLIDQDELKGSIDSQQIELSEQQDQIDKQQNQIKEQQDQIDKQQNQIREQTNSINHLHSNVENLTGELTHKNQSIDTLKKQQSKTYRVLDSTFTKKDHQIKLQTRKGSDSLLKLRIKRALFPFMGKAKKKLLNDKFCILKSELFSPAFYLSSYDDVRTSHLDPLSHYCIYGWKEGRDPGLHFSTSFYLNTYQDVETHKVNPLKHYIVSGAKEGRDPHPDFSTREYLLHHPEIEGSELNPLQHYINSLDPMPNPQEQLNVEANKTSTNSNLRAEFDESFYLSMNPNTVPKGIEPFQYFIDKGWKEGHDPSPNFSTTFYLQCNPDVDKAGINPLVHYVESGRLEQRATQRELLRKFDPTSASPSILFVGHSAAQGGAEVVLLDIIRWYAENTLYQIKIILLAPGSLASEYMHYGDVLTLNDADELTSEKTSAFLDFHYDLIYLNTVVTGSFATIYKNQYAKHKIPIVLHVHEMSKVIETFKEEFTRIEKHVDLYLAASTRVKEDLVNDYNISPDTISVHHSFVQSKATSETELSQQTSSARKYFDLNDKDIVLIGSGTAYWRKGPDLFVETISQVIKQARDLCLGKNIVGIWMGDGEDLADLQSQVEEQGLSSNIRFTGFLKNASELVAAADIFFLSSREDPFPLVCLEAAQYKTPIVCFKEATGMIEFIQDDAGITIPKIDIPMATKYLIDLIQDEGKRKQLGSEARSRFLQGYSSESRIQKIFIELKNRYSFEPSLSVIVPNYNHAAFLKERIDSVVNQSFYDLEILLLDDASSDNSLEVINCFTNDPRVKVFANNTCSGSPFKQWKKGLEVSTSDYLWIAESDDTCTNNFAETLLQSFNDRELALAFCKSEIIDEEGTLIPDALTPYMERAHPTKFQSSYVLDGNIEVTENFAVACTIVNASSAIFRKAAIKDAIDSSMDYKMCGDWHLYLHALSQGKIAYRTETVNYFRRHQTSTVHAVEGTDLYFKERYKITNEVVNRFNVSKSVLQRMLSEVDSEWSRFTHIKKELTYAESFNKKTIFLKHKENYVPPLKIGFYVHGFLFSKGGIERLAADLAHYLTHRGHDVTIFCREYGTDKPIYLLDESIKVVPIFNESYKKLSIKKMRKTLRDYELDVFVPMLSEWVFEPVIKAAEGLGFPIITSEHNCPVAIEANWWNHESRVKTFEKADRIHLVREGFNKSLPEHLQKKITIIPNGSNLGKWIDVDHTKTYKRILSAGRLAPQKRFDRLIKAFALATESIDSEWVLDIYGEGPDERELMSLIAKCGMNDRIKLRGSTDYLDKEYLTSDIFVSSSAFEAGPIVVIEAQMFGLPCIGYNNCSGTNEAIHHEADGLLVDPDTDGSMLCKAIVALAHDERLRQKYAKASKSNARKLNMRNLASQWESMLIDTHTNTNQ